MPNERVTNNPYIGQFLNIEQVDESQASPGVIGLHPGDLGQRAILTEVGTGTKEYQKVQLDSGATSATPAGALVAGTLTYWKDKSKYLVTNDSRMAIGGQTTHGWRNEVAGVITRVAPTAGNQTWVQQKGNYPTLKIASGAPNQGDQVVSDTSATAAQGLLVAANTAPLVQSLGKAAATSGAVVSLSVDLDIPGIP